MRGKETRGDHITTEFRIPPAYAGKSSVPSQFRMNRRDHPRICGEKPVLPCQFMYVSGSPPHMRGKDFSSDLLHFDVRITPAYAGKSLPAFRSSSPSSGLPPHMRGKVVAHGCLLLDVGITPAYAGKSTAGAAFDRAVEDHPRICGEKVYRALSPDFHQGSPPHMRGKGVRKYTLSGIDGITPAYAGKRRHTATAKKVYGDHPRICGEKRVLCKLLHSQQGSPPHMRGKVRLL